jgi:hypothetical protein
VVNAALLDSLPDDCGALLPAMDLAGLLARQQVVDLRCMQRENEMARRRPQASSGKQQEQQEEEGRQPRFTAPILLALLDLATELALACGAVASCLAVLLSTHSVPTQAQLHAAAACAGVVAVAMELSPLLQQLPKAIILEVPMPCANPMPWSNPMPEPKTKPKPKPEPKSKP